MAIYALGDLVPDIDPTAYVHPMATVIGRVRIGPESTIWPSAVLRGDHGPITIGARTSIQDGAVIHTTEQAPTTVGNDCTIGHLVHLEGCIVEDGALIGSNAVVLHRAVIGSGAIVGASALVTGRVHVPPHAMALGVPAKIRLDAVDPGTDIAPGAKHYVQNGKWFAEDLRRLD